MPLPLWTGRFRKGLDRQVNAYNASISFDARLYRQDILGSMAHTTMLAGQGIISKEDENAIRQGLHEILDDMDGGRLVPDPDAEDIHMFIEAELTRRVGDAGKRLHTGRSRNDQVALDLRLYLRDVCLEIREGYLALYQTLISIARQHLHTIMPGYTHLQRAQPVTLAHHLMAYVEMLARDIGRLDDMTRRMDVMPLGSGALAGTTYPLDREQVAGILGFSAISLNSMDAVSDRDFVIELAAALALFMVHASRLCEELILWSSQEYAFIELDDAYSTGSSIMPQKKNPDVAELIRGKIGRVYGDLFAILTLLKGLPMTYNRDLQEDKEPLFDAVDTVKSCLSIFCEMINNTRFHSAKMAASASKGFSTATEIAEYLVEKKVPFRRAHDITGKIVAYCLRQKKDLQALTLKEYQAFYRGIQSDILDRIQPESAVRMRGHIGGTAPQTVLQRIKEFEKRFSKS